MAVVLADVVVVKRCKEERTPCPYCGSNKPVPTRHILSKRRDTENCTKSVLQSRNPSLSTYITICYRLYIQIRGAAVAVAIALFSVLNSRLYVRRLVSAVFVFTTSIPYPSSYCRVSTSLCPLLLSICRSRYSRRL